MRVGEPKRFRILKRGTLPTENVGLCDASMTVINRAYAM
jgi:hypothetical protein